MKSRLRVIRKSNMTLNPKYLRIKKASGNNPRRNLALESVLFQHLSDDELILYLWQNEPTVVIGRNQNPFKECDLESIRKDGVNLVRRMSGGGAVYHDPGNLCFTFLAYDPVYDEKRQTKVIQRALELAGISSEFSGRNDLLSSGRKFSGNAYYHHAGKSYHHGTLLVNSELTRLSDYLKPEPEKLSLKGVDSVRSRVMNLTEVNPDLTVSLLEEYLTESFAKEYGLVPETVNEDYDEETALAEKKFSDLSWIMGNFGTEDCSIRKRFPWGLVRISYAKHIGTLEKVRIDTDAMETGWVEELEQNLSGITLNKDAVLTAIRNTANFDAKEDLCAWITDKETIL